MAKYLVLRRTKLDRVYLPGELVDTDEIPVDQANTLMRRDYLIIVPDDYSSGAVSEPPSVTSADDTVEATPPASADSPDTEAESNEDEAEAVEAEPEEELEEPEPTVAPRPRATRRK